MRARFLWMTEPVFVVVGHPNKGKSSLVATLAQDESVRISAAPGTTTKARRFPMRVDGELLYTLVDTPGFQRARAVLHWLQRESSSARDRPATVARFLEQHRGSEKYAEECELLAPIVAGAGILYVVDGSVPYGTEYEAEMEILRWTGQPSMAIINPVGEAVYVDEWRDALDQFFRMTRVLDALTAPFDQRLKLLGAFGELRVEWQQPLTRAVEALQTDRLHARRESAQAIAALLASALTLYVDQPLAKGEAGERHHEKLVKKYCTRLRRFERHARKRVEQVYTYFDLQRYETELELLDEDLFAEETWLLFGLRSRDLVGAAAASGAAAGGGVDIALGGSSLLLGAALGAIVGGTAAWLSADKLAKMEVVRLPLGRRVLRYGPTGNPNLAFVLLGRARLHHALVAGRTHATRGPLDLEHEAAERLNPLTDDQRKTLLGHFKRLQKLEPDGASAKQTLTALTDDIEPLLDDDLLGND